MNLKPFTMSAGIGLQEVISKVVSANMIYAPYHGWKYDLNGEANGYTQILCK